LLGHDALLREQVDRTHGLQKPDGFGSLHQHGQKGSNRRAKAVEQGDRLENRRLRRGAAQARGRRRAVLAEPQGGFSRGS
jgi:hypothetical protein